MSWCRHCCEDIQGETHLATNRAKQRVLVCHDCFTYFKANKKWPPLYLRENHNPTYRAESVTLDYFDQAMTEFEHYRWAGWYKRVLKETYI